MAGLDDLCSCAHDGPVDAGHVPTLRVADDTMVAPALGRLVTYFGADPSRSEVRLEARGEFVGYVGRDDLVGLVTMQTMGFGGGDVAFLPGTSHLLEFDVVCPVPGCGRRLAIDMFDEDDPPRCSVHPDAVMEFVA